MIGVIITAVILLHIWNDWKRDQRQIELDHRNELLEADVKYLMAKGERDYEVASVGYEKIVEALTFHAHYLDTLRTYIEDRDINLPLSPCVRPTHDKVGS